MSLLFLAGESDADEDFYAACAEKITGMQFSRYRLRNRRGDGLDAVQRQMRNAILLAKATAEGPEPVAFIAGMDNDRAPHPENSERPPEGTGLNRAKLPAEDRMKPDRHEWMLSIVERELTSNRAAWKLRVALAVPVEMIESWIVHSLREHPPQPMPHFSTARSSGVREYYEQSTGDTPPQWKDLADAERVRLGLADDRALQGHFVAHLDADALASRSLSFRQFKEWLDGWTRMTR